MNPGPSSWWPIRWLLPLIIALAVVRLDAGEPPAAWVQWQQERREAIAGTNGWATLAGLFWLKEGTNSAGVASTNAILLPPDAVPANAGVFIRHGTQVRFEAAAGMDGQVDAKPVRRMVLQNDVTGEPTVLGLGRLQMFVIIRGDRVGLRVRDPQAGTRTHFEGLRYFPWQTLWVLPARFEAHPAEHTLAITDVTGALSDLACPGALVFTVAGQEYRLDALEDAEAGDLWVLFRDRTSGKSTYATGRYLHVAKPDANGRTTLDFNHAYNPPCAFTPFATCPLAPRQNWLPFAIEAGEKKYGEHHKTGDKPVRLGETTLQLYP